MIPLTEEQCQALAESREPLRLQDFRTQREYVLLQAELYERLRRLAEAEWIDPSFYEFDEPENR